MSRAVRRQKGGSSDGGGGSRVRPFGSRQPRQTRGNRPQGPQRRGFRPGIPNWIVEIWSELRKVTWPTRDETAYLTMVVIVVAIAVGILLGGIDIFFNWFIDNVLFE